MQTKKIIFGQEVRDKILKGSHVIAEAVGSSLGPKGRLTIFNTAPGFDIAPTALRDGVSIANNINVEDPFEDQAVRLVKEAARKQVSQCGDGTSVTIVLTDAIIAEALPAVSAGVNPMTIKAELEDSRDTVLAELNKLSKEVTTDEEIQQVATVSASSAELGELVASTLKQVGPDGVVTVEKGTGLTTTVDFQEGLQIDKGFLSPKFVTAQNATEVVIEDAYILMTDRKLNHPEEIIPFLDTLIPTTKNLVIFAGEVVESALQFLVVNTLVGKLNAVAVQAPAYGLQRTEELDDLATVVGGAPVFFDSGRDLKTVTIEELGRAEKVIVSRDKTVVINGAGDKAKLIQRQDDLRKQIELAKNDYEKTTKENRLARLSGGVAVINVGGATEPEVLETKERVIDAVAATKAALEEGIVAGGEITMYTLASHSISKILANAMRKPLQKLLENAGMDYTQTLVKLSNTEYPTSVDILDGNVKDLVSSGVIDPTKVIRCAITNAVSVAILALSTHVMIAEVEKE